MPTSTQIGNTLEDASHHLPCTRPIWQYRSPPFWVGRKGTRVSGGAIPQQDPLPICDNGDIYRLLAHVPQQRCYTIPTRIRNIQAFFKGLKNSWLNRCARRLWAYTAQVGSLGDVAASSDRTISRACPIGHYDTDFVPRDFRVTETVDKPAQPP